MTCGAGCSAAAVCPPAGSQAVLDLPAPRHCCELPTQRTGLAVLPRTPPFSPDAAGWLLTPALSWLAGCLHVAAQPVPAAAVAAPAGSSGALAGCDAGTMPKTSGRHSSRCSMMWMLVHGSPGSHLSSSSAQVSRRLAGHTTSRGCQLLMQHDASAMACSVLPTPACCWVHLITTILSKILLQICLHVDRL